MQDRRTSELFRHLGWCNQETLSHFTSPPLIRIDNDGIVTRKRRLITSARCTARP